MNLFINLITVSCSFSSSLLSSSEELMNGLSSKPPVFELYFLNLSPVSFTGGLMSIEEDSSSALLMWLESFRALSISLKSSKRS